MDIKTLLEGIEKLLNYMFRGQPPAWLLPTIAWLIGLGLVFSGIVFILSQAQKLWTEFIQPKYYKPEDKQRLTNRQMFAVIMEAELRKLNSREAWSDRRFAELEAEVETEGGRKLFDLVKFGLSSASSLRKEKSLSRALERSSERLILVEGDPGSGKTVALRHLAQIMARKASQSKNLKTVIPLYINLKQLRRSDEQTIDKNLIEDFIIKTLKQINDSDVEAFVDEEFTRGLREGTWLFLFDSFDEIHDILSSTEADAIIRQYAEAISDFLHRMNRCRGIVASREYKGPRFLGWPKFRILPLTLNRKVELIRHTRLRVEVQKAVIHGISQSATDFRYLTSNPMFLNLLCEFMNKKNAPEFPRHTHNIFNDYVWKRLKHDEERLQRRFSKTPSQIRDAAEKLAFCMTADTGIGLSPTVQQLEASTQKLQLDLGAEFAHYVDAIDYLKLGRLEQSIEDGNKYFTFAHRRFQEYFATAVVLREPDRIDTHLLLTDARWRETAVVILQTQPPETIVPLFTEIHDLLRASLRALCENRTNTVESEPVVLPSYTLGKLGKGLFESSARTRQKTEQFIQTMERFMNAAEQEDHINVPLDWPKHLFHILGILQEGLSTKYELLPANIRQMIDDLLLFIMRKGSLDDRKWALDIAGCATLGVLEKAIDVGLSSPGTWVKNSAILQISKLPQVPAKFSKHIISNLLLSAQEEILLPRRYEIYAQFSRFADVNYLYVASLIVWMPFVDLFLTVVSVMLIAALRSSVQGPGYFLLDNSVYLVFVLFLAIVGYIIRWRSTSILQAISDIYSTGLLGNPSRFSPRLSKWLRVKQPKRSDISLTKKLMSLLTGSMFSVGGIALFIFVILSSKLYVKHPYVWASLILFASFQLWPLMATLEAFRLKRTSAAWRLIYFFYPAGLSLVFPVVFILYLLDQCYLVSRMGIAVPVLMKSKIRERFVPFMYQGNHYAELWMPAPLMLILILTLTLGSLLTTAAVEFVVAFVAIALLILGYLFFRPMLLFVKEWRKYTAAKKSVKHIDIGQFVSMVEEITNRRYRSRLIYAVLDKGSLNPTPANINRLRMLIAFIQTSLANEYTAQNFEGLIKMDKELAITLGYVDENNYPSTNYWNEDQLDLLCRMLEQMQKVKTS